MMRAYTANGDDESEEIINREDVWHFYAYFAGNAFQLLREFLEVADIINESEGDIRFGDHPVKAVGMKQFKGIVDAFELLIDYYKQITDHYEHEGFVYQSREIDFERGDTIVSLLDSLHLFVNILPYLNKRHYALSKELYDERRYHRFTFEELENLDRTLAKTILPTFVWFANHSIFCPKQLSRLYTYPKPNGSNSFNYNCHEQWGRYLTSMVDAWEWIRDRKVSIINDKWEDVPDEIYYGLHLFAEYLPEMQND